MIQFLGVSKIYKTDSGQIRALDNVSFEINSGEFVFLVGHSGSGKTTILRQLIREELPTEGRIYFEDNEVTKLKRNGVYQLRRQIGIIFQDYKLLEDKNAYENIAFAMEAAGHKSQSIKDTVPYVLEIVNLQDRGTAFPKQLSGGEKQRVAIARALANNPKLLIADEPTGNLDPDSAWDIVQILSKINKWGTTVLMSTHGTEIVNSLQKRVLQMEKGQLVRDSKKGQYDEPHASDVIKEPISVGKIKKASDIKAEIASENSENLGKTTKQAKADLPKDTEDTKVAEDVKDTAVEETEPIKDGEDKPNKQDNTLPKTNEDAKEEIAVEVKAEIGEKPKTKTQLDVAADSELTTLKISAEIVEVLEKNGYKKVEDILKDGMAKVNKHLSQKQVRSLARAIKKFVTSE